MGKQGIPLGQRFPRQERWFALAIPLEER